MEEDTRAHEFALRVAAMAREPRDVDYDVVSKLCPADCNKDECARVVASFRAWEVLSERERVLAQFEVMAASIVAGWEGDRGQTANGQRRAAESMQALVADIRSGR